MNDTLEKEAVFFNSKLEEWRQTHLGQFVVIKEDQVLGFYDSLEQAFSEGSKKFGLADFFVMQIIHRDSVQGNSQLSMV